VKVVLVLVVVVVVVLKLGFFTEAWPLANPDPPGNVVDVDVDVDVVSTQFLLLGTWAQLGSATAETAETAIATAKMAATVRSTSIRFTLIHLPFLYSFFPTKSRIDPIVLPLCGPTSFLETKPATGSKDP
jgi:hypothetical protein